MDGSPPPQPQTLGIEAAYTLLHAIDAAPAEVALVCCDMAVDTLRRHMPHVPLMFDGIRYEAESWAELAAPNELVEYIAAGLARGEREGMDLSHTVAARKRLLVALWRSMSEPDKAAFLKSVDPDGNFRGAG